MPIGYVYFNFGYERRSCPVESKEDALLKIRTVGGSIGWAFEENGPYNTNVFGPGIKVELSGIGPDAGWVARQLTNVKVGY